jgi:hypothetical protein
VGIRAMERDTEDLKRALIGVKGRREEAFILLNAVPEEYLNDVIEYFRILTGLKDSPTRFC